MFRHLGKAVDRQTPFAAAVVLPTVLRPSLARAVESVYAQTLDGRIQLLLGIDVASGDPALLDRLAAACPPQIDLVVCDPGYSTSVRHGGLYPNRFSGALRTILSYAANSRYLAYLDDDNWWAPDHLASLLDTIAEAEWAWSQRWFVEAETDEPICIDDWESVGPDAGIFVEQFGGFVDPSSLMVDKFAAHDILPFWSLSPFEDGSGEDRLVFAGLKGALRGRGTGRATSFYTVNPQDPMQSNRLQMMRERGIVLPSARRAGVRRLADVVPWSEPGAAVAPAPPDPLLVELVTRLKPREVVALVEAAEAHGLAALARAHCADSVTAAPGVAEPALGLRPLPPDALDWLAGRTLAVDLVHLGRPAPAGDPGALLQAAWPLLRPGGILVAEAPADGDVARAVAAFAAASRAKPLPAALTRRHHWILEKP